MRGTLLSIVFAPAKVPSSTLSNPQTATPDPPTPGATANTPSNEASASQCYRSARLSAIGFRISALAVSYTS